MYSARFGPLPWSCSPCSSGLWTSHAVAAWVTVYAAIAALAASTGVLATTLNAMADAHARFEAASEPFGIQALSAANSDFYDQPPKHCDNPILVRCANSVIHGVRLGLLRLPGAPQPRPPPRSSSHPARRPVRRRPPCRPTGHLPHRRNPPNPQPPTAPGVRGPPDRSPGLPSRVAGPSLRNDPDRLRPRLRRCPFVAPAGVRAGLPVIAQSSHQPRSSLRGCFAWHYERVARRCRRCRVYVVRSVMW
jgi:hypothetical protein